jgi:hypothetical protein
VSQAGAGTGDEDAGAEAEEPPGAPSRLPAAVRVASHLAVWGAVLVPTVVALSRGFRPFGDDAAIASRAWQVFSTHPPTLGLASAASNQTGHEVYGLGPLLFYLLAIPVHIDPGRGLLWGAALWCGLVLSLTIEAAWAAGRWLAGAAVAVVVLDLLWLTPGVFENLAWNASFPVPFLVASVALAWLVATGATRWFPVLVVTASVVAQCHLFLAVPAAAVALAALGLGLLARGRHGGWGWIAAGAVVGLVCWAAPIFQQVRGQAPNLSAVLHANSGQHTLGVSFGLRDLAMAGAFRPIWLTHLPTGFFPLAAMETAYPAWYGALILAGLAVVGVVGLIWLRPLGALATVTLALCAGLVVSLTVFPTKNILSLAYLVVAFWVAGAALWAVGVWSLVEVVGFVLRWRGRLPVVARAVRVAAPWAVAAGLLGFVGLAALDIEAAATGTATSGWSPAEVRLVDEASATLARDVPAGPLRVIVAGPDFYGRTWAAEGILYRMESEGWQPGTTGPARRYTGLRAPPGAPTYVVDIQGTRVLAVTRRP